MPPRVRSLKRAACLLLAGAGVAAWADGAPGLRNVTTGGAMRPGIYGRIAFQGQVPPPVIYDKPVIASQAFVPADAKPVYLYVPPGQVRKWKQHCARWSACDEPVLFVRVDDSPSRWGQWRQRRDPVLALHERE
jgi:hypothetical protein